MAANLGAVLLQVGQTDQFMQLTADGIVFGSILILGGIGLSLTYGILKFANFAHGDLMTLGAYLALSIKVNFGGALEGFFKGLLGPQTDRLVVALLSLGVGMLFAALLTPIVAILIDQVLYKRFRRAKAVTLLIASFGVSLFLQAMIQIIWGSTAKSYGVPVRPGWPLPIGARVTLQSAITVITALMLILLTHFFLKYSKTGKAMRAMSDNPDLARVTGINTERVVMATWMIGGSLAAIGGVFLANTFIIRPTMGFEVLLFLFAAVILGGIGSAYGAMAGGLAIGILPNWSSMIIPAAYKPATAFVIMILLLLLRPQGIFGGGRS